MACDCPVLQCSPFHGEWPTPWALQGAVVDLTYPYPPTGGLLYAYSDGFVSAEPPDDPTLPYDQDGRAWSFGIESTGLILASRAFLEQTLTFEVHVIITVMPGENYVNAGFPNFEADKDTSITLGFGVEMPGAANFRGVNVNFQTDRSALGGPSTESTIWGINGVTPTSPVSLGGLVADSYTIRLSISELASSADLIGYGSVTLDPLSTIFPFPADEGLISFRLEVGGQTAFATRVVGTFETFEGSDLSLCGPWISPLPNQPVQDEFSGVGDGSETVFRTRFPYVSESLEPEVDGVSTGADSSDPENREFTLSFAPEVGEEVRVTYRAAG